MAGQICPSPGLNVILAAQIYKFYQPQCTWSVLQTTLLLIDLLGISLPEDFLKHGHAQTKIATPL